MSLEVTEQYKLCNISKKLTNAKSDIILTKPNYVSDWNGGGKRNVATDLIILESYLKKQ